jgi:membrane protein implicated in regulation of membrane protease activity
VPWWGWVIVGAILLGSELMLVDAQFYLVFLGVAAIIVGLAGLVGYGGPAWGQWLAFGALSVFFMAAFRGRLYQKLRGNAPGYEENTVGQVLTLAEGLAPGAETRVEFRGTSWRVQNTAQVAIAPGGRARIERAVGLTLHVTPTE